MMVATQLNKSALFFGPAEQLLGASFARSFISFAMRFCAAISEGTEAAQKKQLQREVARESGSRAASRKGAMGT